MNSTFPLSKIRLNVSLPLMPLLDVYSAKKAMPGWRLDRPFTRLPSFSPSSLCSSMRHSHSLLALKLQRDRSLGLRESILPSSMASHELMLLCRAGLARHSTVNSFTLTTGSLPCMMSASFLDPLTLTPMSDCPRCA